MKRKLLILVLFLSGCALFNMENNLRALEGQPIEQAFVVLGFPDGHFKIRNMDVYIWGRTQSYSYSVPETSTTYGTVNSYGVAPLFGNYEQTTYYNSRISGTAHCQIKIVANAYGTIVHTEHDGEWQACEKYAYRLAGE